MTVEEDRLARWLHDSTPEPPKPLLVEAIVRRAHRQQRARTWVPALAAACVIALIAALIPALGRLGDHHPALVRTTPDRSAGSPSGSTHSAGPTTTPPRTPDALTVHPWHARLLTRSALASLTTVDGELYGVTQDAHRIVRIDPDDGRVLARSTVAAQVSPVLFDGLIWTVGPTARGRADVIGLDPDSLTMRASSPVRIDSAAPFGPVLGADAAAHELAVGSGRHVTVFTGDLRGLQVHLTAGGPVSGVALPADGSMLYVSLVSGTSGRLELFDLYRSAAPTARSAVNGASGDLVGTAGGIWYLGAGGMTAQIAFARGPALTAGPSLTAGTSGGGDDVGPQLSGGVLWLGGDDEIGCADPDTGRQRASTPVGTSRGGDTAGYIDGMSAVGGKVYALYRGVNAGPKYALIEMTPPRACGLA